MELIKKNISVYRQSKRAADQMTLEEDFNVPDIRPDVEQIIQSKARTVVESTRAEQGRLLFQGYVLVSVLYMDDTKERQLHRLDTRIRFEETMNMEGLESTDTVSLTCETEDIDVVMIHSRKLSIRGLLTITAAVDEIYEVSAAVEAKGDLELCRKTRKLEYLQLEVQQKDRIRIREDLQLPSNKPDIREILWETVQLRSYEVQVRNGKLEVEGELFVFVMYNGQEENGTRQWMEQTLPLHQELEIAGCREELIPDVTLQPGQMELQVHPDADGEDRRIHLEGALELEIRLYAGQEMEILEDLFSPEKEVEIFTREELYESMVVRNHSRLRTAGRIPLEGRNPGILQICSSQGTVRADQVTLGAQEIRIEGAILVQILYVSSEDTMPFAVLEGSIPFTHAAEVPGVGDDCRYRLDLGLEQLSATMADSEEIEVRATIRLNLFVVRPHRQMCIADVEEHPLDLEKVQQLPGIVGYMVQEGDSLWEIARAYYTTPKRIMEMNHLESDQVHRGDHLILMKELERVELPV